MATDIYGMLTGGYDPRAEQMKQQQAFQQQLSTATDPRAFIAAVGSNMGRQIGQGAQGLFGVNPEQEKANLKKDALAEVQASGIDMTDQIAVLKAITQALQKRGLTAEAAQVGANIPQPKTAEATKLAMLIQEQSKFTKDSPQWKAYQGAIDKETKAAAGAKSALEKKMDSAGITDPAERQSIAKKSLELDLKANQGDQTAIAALNLINRQLDIQAKQQELAAAEAAKAEQAKAKVQSASAEAYKTNNILNTIKTAKSQVGGSTAGLGGAIMKNLAGSEAVDLEENLLTIKANIGFNELTQMRKDSPTGGALGQVSDMENKALQAARASLEQRQSPAQLRKNLEKIEDSYERWLKVITGEWTEADAQAYLDSLKEQEQEKEKEQEKPVPNIEDIVLINKYYKVK